MARNILLIQDDPSDAKVVREALINSSDELFQVEWVRSCSEGLERLVREGKQEQKRKTASLRCWSTSSCPTDTALRRLIGSFARCPRFRFWCSVGRTQPFVLRTWDFVPRTSTVVPGIKGPSLIEGSERQ